MVYGRMSSRNSTIIYSNGRHAAGHRMEYSTLEYLVI